MHGHGALEPRFGFGLPRRVRRRWILFVRLARRLALVERRFELDAVAAPLLEPLGAIQTVVPALGNDRFHRARRERTLDRELGDVQVEPRLVVDLLGRLLAASQHLADAEVLLSVARLVVHRRRGVFQVVLVARLKLQIVELELPLGRAEGAAAAQAVDDLELDRRNALGLQPWIDLRLDDVLGHVLFAFTVRILELVARLGRVAGNVGVLGEPDLEDGRQRARASHPVDLQRWARIDVQLRLTPRDRLHIQVRHAPGGQCAHLELDLHDDVARVARRLGGVKPFGLRHLVGRKGSRGGWCGDARRLALADQEALHGIIAAELLQLKDAGRGRIDRAGCARGGLRGDGPLHRLGAIQTFAHHGRARKSTQTNTEWQPRLRSSSHDEPAGQDSQFAGARAAPRRLRRVDLRLP